MNDFHQLQQLADHNRAQNDARVEDVLQVLWDSTSALHKRFGVQPTLGAQTPLVIEETKEVIQAALCEPDSDLAQEIADCVVVLFGLAMARNVPLDAVREGLIATIWKNNRKTPDTHYVNPDTHKITRKL